MCSGQIQNKKNPHKRGRPKCHPKFQMAKPYRLSATIIVCMILLSSILFLYNDACVRLLCTNLKRKLPFIVPQQTGGRAHVVQAPAGEEDPFTREL